MRVEDAAPRIGAVVTKVDVQSLTEPDRKILYQTGLERHVLIVRGQFYRYMLQPNAQYRKWQAGGIVRWDNRCTVHSAAGG